VLLHEMWEAWLGAPCQGQACDLGCAKSSLVATSHQDQHLALVRGQAPAVLPLFSSLSASSAGRLPSAHTCPSCAASNPGSNH
jgi:hypothetical protein